MCPASVFSAYWPQLESTQRGLLLEDLEGDFALFGLTVKDCEMKLWVPFCHQADSADEENGAQPRGGERLSPENDVETV